jgi:cellulose synthase/poly-beta-1,6-N-acetylglucosamine synthase-like glycosyltransferase
MAGLCVTLFLLGSGFALYVVFGYPLFLGWLARRASVPVKRCFEPRSVSVLLAVYNGERWMGEKLESILALAYPRERMEILVISDGSTDGTDDIVRQFEPAGVQLLRVPRGGKAAALNFGMARASGEILFFTDVRQPLEPGCLKSLVSCLGDPTVGAVCGHVLFRGDAGGAHLGLYWRYEKWIRDNHTLLDSILAGTGCIYAMRRELVSPIPSDILLDDSYLPLSAFLRGYRFVLDRGAIAYEFPNSLETEFHRKVRTLAGIYQLVGRFPSLVLPGRRMWLHFLSYKLGRVLLPFALLAMLLSSFGLPGWWRTAAVGMQALFYGLALVDGWIPEAWKVKRAASVARTFVVLMAASLCAVSIFFVPPRRLWKENGPSAG